MCMCVYIYGCVYTLYIASTNYIYIYIASINYTYIYINIFI